ncbi:MAG: GNAT family protein [Candidatus Limnocylindrales bacterium]
MANRPQRAGLRGAHVYRAAPEPEDADLGVALVQRRSGPQAARRPTHEPRGPTGTLRDRRPRGWRVRLSISSSVGSTTTSRSVAPTSSTSTGTTATASFGIAIGDLELWGRGLGTDAVNAIVDFAFGELRLERVMLDTDAENHRAQAAYRKAGFVVEGRRRRHWFGDGAYGDDLLMALLRDEWLALPRLKSWDLMARAIETEGVVDED